MSRPFDRHLVLFTRYPQLGAGKRRLAAGIGPVAALRFQRVSLALAIRRLGFDRRWTLWLAVTPDRSGPWPPPIGILGQGRGDLGRRLQRVISALPAGPIVVIGSDVPAIAAADIAGAFHALGRNDAVFGASPDGGYWLIGLRRRPRAIDPFQGVRWSTEHALADTLANLSGHSVGFVHMRDDVDDATSLARHPHWNRHCTSNRDSVYLPSEGYTHV